mmetsp:Transcript_1693/g.3635  ORF Transcript_1693/g.3635 Transcript_1693/m.3635 type:complete len:560 (-) Transcript_1693:317-1996(-)
MMIEAPLPAINSSSSINNKTVDDDDASELSVESFSRNVSPEEALEQQKQQQEEEEEAEAQEKEESQSYLPQQLQTQSKPPPKLSELKEKWNQSFASSVGSVHSADSPVVYATVNLPSVRSSMATTKRSNAGPPVKIDVTTTATGKPITPPRVTATTTTSAAPAPAAPVPPVNTRTPPRSTRPSKTVHNKTPSRKSTRTPKRSSTKPNRHSHTPPPPDMNAGLYYFAQMGPGDSNSQPEPVIETYQGSCQCGEIQLQVRLPTYFDSNDNDEIGSSSSSSKQQQKQLRLEVETTDETTAAEEKIFYRYIRARQTDFDITKGQAYMSTYFVTMSAPPILASSSSSTASPTPSNNSSSRKSKFFIRPNEDNTSPRSQSKGARVFCPKCGLHVLYIPGKNAPHLHLNINCFSRLAQEYPPPMSHGLKDEAWFWDPTTYSKYLTRSSNSSKNSKNKNTTMMSLGATGKAVLDWCRQLVQDHLGEYLPLIQDFLADYLLPPSSFAKSKGIPDTPSRYSIEESVDVAFQGIPTPGNSFLLDDDDDTSLGQAVIGDDGSFKKELIEID